MNKLSIVSLSIVMIMTISAAESIEASIKSLVTAPRPRNWNAIEQLISKASFSDINRIIIKRYQAGHEVMCSQTTLLQEAMDADCSPSIVKLLLAMGVKADERGSLDAVWVDTPGAQWAISEEDTPLDRLARRCIDYNIEQRGEFEEKAHLLLNNGVIGYTKRTDEIIEHRLAWTKRNGQEYDNTCESFMALLTTFKQRT